MVIPRSFEYLYVCTVIFLYFENFKDNILCRGCGSKLLQVGKFCNNCGLEIAQTGKHWAKICMLILSSYAV